MLASFKTDLHLSRGPQTLHGTIHFLAFLLLVLSFLLSLFFRWRRLNRDPMWRGYAGYTLITAVLYVVLLVTWAWQWGSYLFIANVLVWVELISLRLRTVAGSPPASAPRVR